jgi:hypothetical protein
MFPQLPHSRQKEVACNAIEFVASNVGDCRWICKAQPMASGLSGLHVQATLSPPT